MKITKEWLEEKRACIGGKEWFVNQNETDSLNVLRKLINEKYLDWANWLIVHVMKKKQYVAYAIYAAEQVIDIYEKKHPEDNRPRKAIETAKNYLKNKSNKNASAAAAYAAYAAAAYAAAYAAAAASAAAASAAAYAASAAAYAAAAYAAYAAATAAASAASADADADAEKENMKIKILEYGISLLEEN